MTPPAALETPGKKTSRSLWLVEFLAGLVMFIGAANLVFSATDTSGATKLTLLVILSHGSTFVSGFALLLAAHLVRTHGSQNQRL